MSLINRLYSVENTIIQEANKVSNFLPFKSKNNLINYENISNSIIGILLGKQLKPRFSYKKFWKKLERVINDRLSDQNFIKHIKEMYENNQDLEKIDPQFTLLQTNRNNSQTDKHFIKLFTSFLCHKKILPSLEIQPNSNFIEKLILEELKKYLSDNSVESSESVYLPELADYFCKDITFLAGPSTHLFTKLPEFLELHAFLYCSQLALNINGWNNPPNIKPLYFILETEKASQERNKLWQHGYQLLYKSVGDLFPIMTLLECFNDTSKNDGLTAEPLWKYIGDIKNATELEKNNINKALQAFGKNYQTIKKCGFVNENNINELTDPIETIKFLIKCAKSQFHKDRGNTKHEIYDDYKKQFESEIASQFVQQRGRSGKILVLNQDFLLLLTNLAIGNKKKIRFQELLSEFRSRGVYFDKQSEKALINFFKRVGNVNRMSDSGDAVYVASTF